MTLAHIDVPPEWRAGFGRPLYPGRLLTLRCTPRILSGVVLDLIPLS